MLRPDSFARVSAAAVVPEQIIAYVRAVSGSRPRLVGSCIAYQTGTELVLVGYPLPDPTDETAMAAAVDEALTIKELSRLTVIGPARPPQAPAGTRFGRDCYALLPLPPPAPGQKLRNMLRRAARELTVQPGRLWGEEHQALVDQYLASRSLDSGTIHIFRQIPDYLAASGGSLLFSARTSAGRLAALVVGEFASLETAFFMFCFRDPQAAPPGSTDLLLAALVDEAVKRGHARLNLGLGINEGVRFFKRKWGASAELPCFQGAWDIEPPGLARRLRAFFGKEKQ
jgi:hypothetical protein